MDADTQHQLLLAFNVPRPLNPDSNPQSLDPALCSLSGYSSKVTGKDAIERLDIRCARKADKFCK